MCVKTSRSLEGIEIKKYDLVDVSNRALAGKKSWIVVFSAMLSYT